MKKTVKDIQIRGKRVLVRVDFNVPLDPDGHVADDMRIVKTLPTIQYILSQNSRLILMSHLGRPKGFDPKASLAPAARHLEKLVGRRVELLKDCIGDEVRRRVFSMKEGEVVLLENLRFHSEEEKNDPEFARDLSALGEVYVDDAFGACHRAHASVEGVTKYLPAVSGLLLAREIEYFEAALHDPKKPFVTILGGAKVSDKIKVIENLLAKVDALLIGGGMAYTFLKVKGQAIGRSKLEEPSLGLAKEILAKAERQRVKIVLPVDHVCGDSFSEKAQAKICEIIDDDWIGLDIGPKTIELFKKELAKAKVILWNGPLGVAEWKSFANGTRSIAEFLFECPATTILGGGDTASAIKDFDGAVKISHISTGGGACLEFLEGKVLPGIAALQDKEPSQGTAPLRSAATRPPCGTDGSHGGASTAAEAPGQAGGLGDCQVGGK